ncbi:MAG: hypothetical protein K2L62_05880, partial [Muribaculaceae bacterium]|nr:hypothetical protein [Muribaculaceae bacterium]
GGAGTVRGKKSWESLLGCNRYMIDPPAPTLTAAIPRHDAEERKSVEQRDGREHKNKMLFQRA